MAAMALGRKFAGNFFVQIAGRVLAVFIGLVSIGILTRTLGTESYGEYTTAMTFLQMFGVVVDFGLTLTLVVMISEKGADEKKIVGNFLSLRLISGAILFTLAPLTVLAFPWSEAVKTGVAVGALSYLLMAGATMLIGIFQKHQSMWRAALAELINRAVLLAVIVWFASMNLGVVAMIGAGIVSNFAWLVVMIHFAKPFVSVVPQFDFKVWKQALSKSWPIAISIIFNLLYLKGDILFLAYFREQSEVGLYGFAYKLIDVLTALPVMFMGLLLPALVADFSLRNLQAFREHMATSFDLFMLGTIPVIVGAQVVAEPLMVLIAGPDFETSGTMLKLLILAMLGVFLGALWGHAVVAINKQKEMIWGYAFVAIVAVVGYLLYIPAYGAWGAIWVTLVSEALIAFLTFAMVYKNTKALPNLTVTVKALLSSAAMYLVLVLLPDIHVLIEVSIGAVVYVVLIFALGGVKVSSIRGMLAKPEHPAHS